MANQSSIDLKNLDWHYRGEGNKNLVIAFNNNKILRITKTTKNDDKMKYASKLNYKKFYDYLFPLLQNYIQEQQIVYINEEDIQILNEKLENLRPKHRLYKHLQYGEAILCSDYTFLPFGIKQSSNDVFCVELKLKQGWIPISDRTIKCTYCLHQYYKLSLGQILKISKYCPLNIFSGNYSRMKHALKSLLDHPQNNLQIFKNGQLVYANDYTEAQLIKTLQEMFHTTVLNTYELYENFYEIIIKMLLKNYNSMEQPIIIKNDLINDKNSCKFLSENHKIASGSVLNILYEIQSSKKSSLLATYSIYCKLLEIFPNLNEWDIIKIQSQQQIDESIRSILIDYLMFSTFRDCSIMLTFTNQTDQNNQLHLDNKSNILLNNGMIFETNIGITDLDPKTLGSLKKHWIQMNDALEAYKTLSTNSEYQSN